MPPASCGLSDRKGICVTAEVADSDSDLRGWFVFSATTLFFVSGIPALIYQVAWQRILCLHSGTGIYSIAMVVAAFMMGLGIGNQLGGMLSVRWTPRQCLFIFALAETTIGLFALVSCALYYDQLYHRGFWTAARWWQLGLAHFTALVLPTTLMGATLPLLVRATVLRTDVAGRIVSRLYGANALGAAAGAAVTPWILIGFCGIRGAVAVGAAANCAVAVGALLLLRRLRRVDLAPAANVGSLANMHDPPSCAARCSREEEDQMSLPLSLWGVLYALSGFLALGLEMIWFRVLDVAIKSTSLTYGTVLSIYLAGFGLGCFVAAPLAMRSRRPLTGFLACQCGSLIYAALPILALAYGSETLPLLRTLIGYWQLYEGLGLRSLEEFRLAFLLYILLPIALYFVPTVLMGASFTFLQRAVHRDPRTSGRIVGLLQALNIVGCTLGSLVVGLLGLHLLGAMGSLRLLLAVGTPFAVLGTYYAGLRSGFPIATAGMVLLLALLPNESRWWSRLHGRTAESVLVAEDASGVAVIGRDQQLDRHCVWLNGKGQSSIPFVGIHTKLGALPVLVHPQPVDVAVIGLGSGGTAFAAACRPDTARLQVFEICTALPRLLTEFMRLHPTSELSQLLADARLEIALDDGRNALFRGDTRYDVIEADALRPNSAYSGNLYSVEFFRSCATRLKPGGLFCAWAPTLAARRAFCDVFPHVITFQEPILIGSLQPLEIDRDLFQTRTRRQETWEWLGREIAQQIETEFESCEPYDRLEIAGVPPNRDLFPRDEFEMTRYLGWRLWERTKKDLCLPFGKMGKT